MFAMSDANLDKIISTLLKVKAGQEDAPFRLDENTITALCHKSRDIFLAEKNVLDIQSPLQVCGDIHGQYSDLLRIFARGGYPPASRYLFLGDYIDRGKQSLETIALLLAYKVRYPDRFFMLRGNHETATMTRMYGFHDECKRRCSIKMWKTFSDVFRCIPLAAIVDMKIFCCHGGLSPEMESVNDIRRIKRPIDIPPSGVLTDLMWADPAKDVVEWAANIDRGVSVVFGAKIVDKFLKLHHFDLIVRAHQVVEDGYEFFANKKLVTIFSAPNYCGQFENKGAIMSIDATLKCSFQVFQIAGRSVEPESPPETEAAA